mmetsp:Transcript_28579/g.62899  ORF Transcript_28579/g.62899 Transcript_28579/m.62899 type:complete len:201 (+) Transcript_28579:170-772(+)
MSHAGMGRSTRMARVNNLWCWLWGSVLTDRTTRARPLHQPGRMKSDTWVSRTARRPAPQRDAATATSLARCSRTNWRPSCSTDLYMASSAGPPGISLLPRCTTPRTMSARACMVRHADSNLGKGPCCITWSTAARPLHSCTARAGPPACPPAAACLAACTRSPSSSEGLSPSMSAKRVATAWWKNCAAWRSCPTPGSGGS